MTLNKRLTSAIKTSDKEAVPSVADRSFGKRGLIRAILVAGSLSSAACATLGYEELAAISKQCRTTTETCQNSLTTVLEKRIDEKNMNDEDLEKYSTSLNEAIDTVIVADLDKSRHMTQSLKLIEKFDPPTWAEELSDPNLDESQITVILKSANGILKSIEEDPSYWMLLIGKDGSDMLEQLAHWTVDLANLKLTRIKVEAKYSWFININDIGPVDSGKSAKSSSADTQKPQANPDAGAQGSQANADAGAQPSLEPEEIADRMVTDGEEFICFASGGRSPEQAAMDRFIKLTGLEREVAEAAFEPEIIETQTDGLHKTKAKMKIKEVAVPGDAGSPDDTSVDSPDNTTR